MNGVKHKTNIVAKTILTSAQM